MPFLIRVPATSANLGPGFDCLGLALDLWNEIEVEVTGGQLEITIEGEGASTIPTNKRNAIYQAMLKYAERHQRTLPAGIRLKCKNNIPLGSGLGSSSAAAVGGILACAGILGLATDKTDQLDFATQLEGHPDNVAPCLMGGLTAAIIENQQVVARKLAIAPLSLVIVLPEFHFPTKTARAALPVDVSRQDAVFNLSRLVFLIDALAKGDLDLLPLGMQDLIHQPYRIPLIPGATAAITAAKKNGAAAVVLSGAGPSLLAVLRTKEDQQIIGQVMMEAFQLAGFKSRLFTPEIEWMGATTKVL